MFDFKHLSIAFDLDGTLVESHPDLLRVLNAVVAPDGVPPVDSDRLRTLVGYGSRALIERAYKDAGKSLTGPRCDQVQKDFLKLYAQDIAQLTRPYPGVVQTLATLKRAGASLSVCTNKPGYLARPLISQLAMTPFFDRIIGSDDTAHKKPAAGHIFHAAGHRQAQHIVMIGDSAPDTLAAKAAKAISIVMRYGYSPVPVETLGADVILRNFRDIPNALTELQRHGLL